MSDFETLRRLDQSRDLIAARFSETLKLEDAAEFAYLSPFYFHRLFSERFGQTPLEFQRERRLELAKRLLAHGDLSVTEICFEVGYASLGSFSAMFQRLVGCTPTQYREGVAHFYALSGFRAHRFIPTCFLTRGGALDLLKPGAGLKDEQDSRSERVLLPLP